MKFWKIIEPDYESDYQDEYTNGELRHPYSLPGVSCSACGETWGGSRLLPFACPDALRTEKHINEAWPIAVEEFKCLSDKVVNTLKNEGLSINELLPGDTFMQPCNLDIPGSPKEDFLWCSIGSIVVSSRIKDCLVINSGGCISDLKITNIRTHPSDESQFSLPDSGEPEDITKGVIAREVKDMDGYYEICVREEYLYAGCYEKTVCDFCQRKVMECSKANVENEILWQGAPIFKIKGTHHFVITDSLKNKLMLLRPSNINIMAI